MNKIYLKTIVTFFVTLTTAFAQSSTDGLWSKLDTKQVAGDKVRRSSFPSSFHLYQLNLNALRATLTNAPILFSNTNQSDLIL